MAQITKTVGRLLADNERRALASDLSATIRSLDRADRRAAADADVAPYLARAILGLDTVAQGLAAWRPKHAEPVDPFLVQEHATLKKQVDEMVRKYLVRYGDPAFVRLGAVAWAKQVVRRVAAEKAATEQRRVTRAAGQPAPKRTVRTAQHGAPVTANPWDDETVQMVMAKMKSGRPGVCDTCGKQRERKTLQGLCSDCITKHFPTLRR